MSSAPMSEIWYHGRVHEIAGFDPDRPAFFAKLREEVEPFVGPHGYVVEARITVHRPIDGDALLKLAEEMGLEDVYAEDYDGFPGPSDHLYDSRMRRRLEQLGYDAFMDNDGYISAIVVWDPSKIEILSQEPFEAPSPAMR